LKAIIHYVCCSFILVDGTPFRPVILNLLTRYVTICPVILLNYFCVYNCANLSTGSTTFINAFQAVHFVLRCPIMLYNAISLHYTCYCIMYFRISNVFSIILYSCLYCNMCIFGFVFVMSYITNMLFISCFKAPTCLAYVDLITRKTF
jgi:hypothetical protein